MIYSISKHLIATILAALLLSACDQQAEPPADRWQKVSSTDPADGSETLQMMIAANNKLPSQKDNAALVLSCQNGVIDAYVIWRQYLGTYDPEVTWRAGVAPAVTETWALSSDNEATFAKDPVNLIKQMLIHNLLMIKTTPFDSVPITIAFNTAGISSESTEFRAACNW